MLCLLLHAVDDPAREITPVDPSLGDGHQAHTRFAEWIDPMPCFNAVETRKTVLVLCKNRTEFTCLSILDHLPKLNTFLRCVARYGFVSVPTDNAVAFTLGKLCDFLSLLFRTRFLPVGRHAYVGDGFDQWMRLQVR